MTDSKFVILYDEGALRIASNSDVSKMYDMADCSGMEGVKEILAVNESGDLVPVTVDPRRWRINQGEEFPFHYARSDIYAGKRQVGTVTWTDH